MKLMKRRNMVAPRMQPHPLREVRINSQTTQYGERPYFYTNIEDILIIRNFAWLDSQVCSCKVSLINTYKVNQVV